MPSVIPERQTHALAELIEEHLGLPLPLRPARGHLPVRRPQHRHRPGADACYPNQFLEFVKERRRLPATESHVVCDNYATHKHAEVRK
jgi:hypothetical protein